MPIVATDLPAIEEALHRHAPAVVLGDGQELKVKVVRPKANAGAGAHCVQGILAEDGVTKVQFNEHDQGKKSAWTDLSKAGRRVTWVLVGMFPNRAAVPMLDGKLSKEVPLLPGAVVETADADKEGAGAEAKAKAKAKVKAKADKAAEEPPGKKPKKGDCLPAVAVAEEAAEAAAAAAAAPATEAVLRSIDRDTQQFWDLEAVLAANIHGRNEDYNAKRLKEGKKPISFVLVAAEVVDNPSLSVAFELRRKQISEARGGKEARERHAFHGTHPSRLTSLCDRGLLPFGHKANPAEKPVDSGYFGCSKKGVYVSRYADYTLKYANRLIPLRPGERCRIVLFRCLPGLSKHIEKLCGPIAPTPGFDSHSSPQYLEWYLFNADQCCPCHVLTIEAHEDTRTAADDK